MHFGAITDPLLQFGNDADDMRGTGRGINPDVNIYDLSSDPVAYASSVGSRQRLPHPRREFCTGCGQPQEVLRSLRLNRRIRDPTSIMTRQIGGVRYNRATPEQLNGAAPYTPVSESDQKAAMQALAKYAFAPDAFEAQADVLAYLQAQRRGFGFFGRNEDPKVHARVASAQKAALAQLVHPSVLMRILDSGLYGNTYDLNEYMRDLVKAIFLTI